MILPSNVIGPIQPEDWLLLLMIKQSLKYMKNKDYSKFRIAIDKETTIYQDILNKYRSAA